MKAHPTSFARIDANLMLQDIDRDTRYAPDTETDVLLRTHGRINDNRVIIEVIITKKSVSDMSRS